MERVLEDVSSLLDSAAKKADPDAAFRCVEQLAAAGQISGIAQSKALWTIRNKWRIFGASKTTAFEDETFLRVGLASSTVRRYVDVWDMFEHWSLRECSPDTRTKLLSRPIGDLIALAQYQNEHGKLDAEQIDKVANATDTAELRKFLRIFKGEDPNSDSMTFVLRRDGTVEAWEKNNVVTLGFIRIDDEGMKEPLRKRAVEKLKKRARLMEE